MISRTFRSYITIPINQTVNLYTSMKKPISVVTMRLFVRNSERMGSLSEISNLHMYLAD